MVHGQSISYIGSIPFVHFQAVVRSFVVSSKRQHHNSKPCPLATSSSLQQHWLLEHIFILQCRSTIINQLLTVSGKPPNERPTWQEYLLNFYFTFRSRRRLLMPDWQSHLSKHSSTLRPASCAWPGHIHNGGNGQTCPSLKRNNKTIKLETSFAIQQTRPVRIDWNGMDCVPRQPGTAKWQRMHILL